MLDVSIHLVQSLQRLYNQKTIKSCSSTTLFIWMLLLSKIWLGVYLLWCSFTCLGVIWVSSPFENLKHDTLGMWLGLSMRWLSIFKLLAGVHNGQTKAHSKLLKHYRMIWVDLIPKVANNPWFLNCVQMTNLMFSSCSVFDASLVVFER